MSKKIIVDDIDVFIEGQGDNTIVMLHGWPDTYRLWDNQVEFLKDNYQCVRFTLPGYDINKEKKLYTLDEIISIISKIIDTVCLDKKVTLLLHDWGCVYGYQYYLEHKDKVEKIIGIDVGDAASRRIKIPFKALLFVMYYQLWLAQAWKFRNGVGTWMNRIMAKRLKAPADQDFIHYGMSYPYYQRWKHIFKGQSEGHLPFFPECPMLYIYGKNKPVMFHSEDFINELSDKKGCEVIGLNTSHWVMKDQPDEFNRIVGEWLQ